MLSEKGACSSMIPPQSLQRKGQCCRKKPLMLAHEGKEVDVVCTVPQFERKRYEVPFREQSRLVVDIKNDLQAMIAPPLYADSVGCFS